MSEFQFKITVIDLPVGKAAKYTGSNGNVVYLKTGQESIVNGADAVKYDIEVVNESDIPVPVIEEPPVDEPAAEGEAQAEENETADEAKAETADEGTESKEEAAA